MLKSLKKKHKSNKKHTRYSSVGYVLKLEINKRLNFTGFYLNNEINDANNGN